MDFTWRIDLVYLKPDACACAGHSPRWHTHILTVGQVLLFGNNALANHTRGSQHAEDLNNLVPVQSCSTSWVARSIADDEVTFDEANFSCPQSRVIWLLNQTSRPLLHLFVVSEFWEDVIGGDVANLKIRRMYRYRDGMSMCSIYVHVLISDNTRILKQASWLRNHS